MFGIRPFLFGLLAGAAGGLFAANYHVVNTAAGVVVVPRTQRPPLRSSYVDIRSWSEGMWASHPEVTQALIADGRASLIGENLKDNLLNEILPQQTQDDRIAPARNVARRTETAKIPAVDAAAKKAVAAQSSPASSGSARLLDSKSSVRKRWEASLDEALAPMVEDDPEEIASDLPGEVLPDAVDNDAMVKQLEERLGGLLDSGSVPSASEVSSKLETIQTSGDANKMARDLLKQVIPEGSKLPSSAAPLRDLGLDFLSAPAPGQGGSATKSQVPTQSQIPQIKPF